MIEDDESRSKLPDMDTKPEDNVLINHIRTAVKKWQSHPKEQQEEYINIPVEDSPEVPGQLNRYQVRLTHQIVRSEYPGLKTTGMGHFVQISNPTPEQQASTRLYQERNRERDITKAVGFRWLLEAIVGGDITRMPDDYVLNGLPSLPAGETVGMFLDRLQGRLRSRRRILVGHNCFTDLVNLYKCFIGDLPLKVEDFEDSVHELFPAIVDTKHIASYGNKRWSNTSLDEVELDLRTEVKPRIDVPPEFDRYDQSASYHEAGYDSLLTARIAIKLSAKMERDGIHFEHKQSPASKLLSGEFGAEEEYTSAAESLSQAGSQTSSLGENIINALAKPVTAVKMFFGQEDRDTESTQKTAQSAHPQAPERQSRDQASPAHSRSQSGFTATSLTPASLLVVKEHPKPLRLSKASEVEKIKSDRASANIYGVLDGKDTMEGGDNLLNFSSESAAGSPAGAQDKKIGAMVEKGEMMPRWDGGNSFWHIFGNKLQVNGSKEGICRIR